MENSANEISANQDSANHKASIRILRDAYAAFNRGDIAAAVAQLDRGSEWNDFRLADVYTFRNGTPVSMRAFADQQDALRWAGAGQGGTLR